MYLLLAGTIHFSCPIIMAKYESGHVLEIDYQCAGLLAHKVIVH